MADKTTDAKKAPAEAQKYAAEQEAAGIKAKDDHTVARKWQKPCLALVPPVDTTYHRVCENLKQQIVSAINEIDEL